MANKLMYYELFNEKADEFLKELVDNFPEFGTDFKRIKTSMMMLRNVDVKAPQRIFNDYILKKYKDAILKKDENVFLEETQFDIYSNRKEHWLEFIENIKMIWKDLSQDNKEIIWKYFHVLVVLTEKCISH